MSHSPPTFGQGWRSYLGSQSADVELLRVESARDIRAATAHAARAQIQAAAAAHEDLRATVLGAAAEDQAILRRIEDTLGGIHQDTARIADASEQMARNTARIGLLLETGFSQLLWMMERQHAELLEALAWSDQAKEAQEARANVFRAIDRGLFDDAVLEFDHMEHDLYARRAWQDVDLFFTMAKLFAWQREVCDAERSEALHLRVIKYARDQAPRIASCSAYEVSLLRHAEGKPDALAAIDTAIELLRKDAAPSRGLDRSSPSPKRSASDVAPSHGLDGQLAELLRRGQKLEAIRVYRQARNVDLKTAKEAVEQLAPGIDRKAADTPWGAALADRGPWLGRLHLQRARVLVAVDHTLVLPALLDCLADDPLLAVEIVGASDFERALAPRLEALTRRAAIEHLNLDNLLTLARGDLAEAERWSEQHSASAALAAALASTRAAIRQGEARTPDTGLVPVHLAARVIYGAVFGTDGSGLPSWIATPPAQRHDPARVLPALVATGEAAERAARDAAAKARAQGLAEMKARHAAVIAEWVRCRADEARLADEQLSHRARVASAGTSGLVFLPLGCVTGAMASWCCGCLAIPIRIAQALIHDPGQGAWVGIAGAFVTAAAAGSAGLGIGWAVRRTMIASRARELDSAAQSPRIADRRAALRTKARELCQAYDTVPEFSRLRADPALREMLGESPQG